ncbi:MAG: polymer-forming cytoskeletal protein [Nitrospinae bacterium]|nr:polymer-forming cytoskeletal protein [Nitrospinota bacterium]MBL7021494.1 polymer-forming cytoskeletal protein [Nitrospinaceae bacterium]
MDKHNLKVLSPDEFDFLATRKWNGVYNRETREKLQSIIEKLNRKKRNCSKAEKILHRVFQKANFGILLEKNTETRGKITHSGKVQVAGKFEGQIIAQAVLIDKTASVTANIAAEVVMCRGRVVGDIRATHKIKITRNAEVKGDIHSPSFIIEKGATFEGRCSMPNIKQLGSFRLSGDAVRKTG